MKVVLAPDSFKGSLSAIEVVEAMKKGITSIDPAAVICEAPMADGGEGITDNIVQLFNGRTEYLEVTGPAGKPTKAKYGVFRENICVIEVAETSGITLLTEDELNPLKTTTFGLGELIKAALDKGYRSFIIGLGGSATNDGGAGMAAALGYRLLDKDGNDIAYGGGALSELVRIDAKNADTRIAESEFVSACDVKNPLCGENGASRIFGPQKGADEATVKVLDDNLKNFAGVIRDCLGKDIAEVPGSGAAGGLGGGAIALLNGRLAEGITIMTELSELDQKIKTADLVLTGEGKCDGQTLNGKTPYGVARIAQKYDVPVVMLAGIVGKGAEALYQNGVSDIYCIKPDDVTVEYSLKHADKLVEAASAKAYSEFIQQKK